MSYTITTTSGTTLATIADGTVNNTSTSLTLIGKNYAGYGVFLNENYVKLLENFSSGSAPSYAIKGQLWFDSANSVLKVYDGSVWKPISSSASGSTNPANPVTGDLWWDSASAQLKVWSGSTWTTIGPAYTSTAGTSGAIVETVSDSSSGSHVIVKFYISNTVVGILSKDSTFSPQTTINGFANVKPGFNLVSTSTVTGAQFTGDASNALTLQGFTASNFLKKDTNETTNATFKVQNNTGFYVGSSDNFNINYASSAVNLVGTVNDADLNIYIKQGSTSQPAIQITGTTRAVTIPGSLTVSSSQTVSANLTVSGTAILAKATVSTSLLPTSNATINIGSVTSKFANVYAVSFIGTSVQAQYADLAERFEADQPYPAGTVVELGGIKEVTAAVQELSEAVFGVISTKAAFLMNGTAGTDQTHPPIAVNGRVPVLVVGKVKKGDRLVSAGQGRARAANRSEMTAFNVIGRALTDKTTDGEGTVEAIVKLNS
jgi:hypothetical protein